jgi:hypothetical protein
MNDYEKVAILAGIMGAILGAFLGLVLVNWVI